MPTSKEEKENNSIPWFPSARALWPLSGKQGFSMCSSCSKKANAVNNECASFLLLYYVAFRAELTSYATKYPSGHFGSAGLVVLPPKIWPTPSLLMGGRMLERQHRCCANTAQQWPKHWGVTNTFLATNAKHGTVRAAMGKMNSIPATPNTISTPYFIPFASYADPTELCVYIYISIYLLTIPLYLFVITEIPSYKHNLNSMLKLSL